MKVITQETYGLPSGLQLNEIDVPLIGGDELLIELKACTINRTDCAILSAKPLIMRLVYGLMKPRVQISGTDYAGVVIKLGENVQGFKLGDRVFGFDDMGLKSHAELIKLNQNATIIHIPENTGFKEAVAIAEGVHYAQNTLNKISLKKEDKVIINGATGAIGIACLQLVKSIGCHVTAVCNTANIDLIRSLGANEIIDYQQEDFTKRNASYNYVFDTVGKSSFFASKHLLKPGGIYISSELGPGLQHLWLSLLFPITKLIRLWGRRGVKFPIPSKPKESLSIAKDLMEQGKLKGIYEREYALADFETAFRYVASGEKTGAVLFSFE